MNKLAYFKLSEMKRAMAEHILENENKEKIISQFKQVLKEEISTGKVITKISIRQLLANDIFFIAFCCKFGREKTKKMITKEIKEIFKELNCRNINRNRSKNQNG